MFIYLPISTNFFIICCFIFKVNNLLKENNVNEKSAIVQDNLVSGWTCNSANLRGELITSN